jgi:hypothetical protein
MTMKINGLLRNHSILRSIALSIAFVFVFVTMTFLSAFDVLALPKTPSLIDDVEFDGTYAWETDLDVLTSADDYITYSDFRNIYCKAATDPSVCASAANGKEIRFDTAEELYRFSLDVSFEKIYLTADPAENVKLSPTKIAVLLSLYYTLGNDIDYSVMNAKTFAPIGYEFRDTSNVFYKNVFTGTFDGRGFAISNLYVAGYDYMIYEDFIDELNSVDIALSPYYSMFTINEGTIKNLGLINPTLELLDTHIDINSTSNLVGFNAVPGVIDHVYVIDNRTDVLEAGIRYRVGTASQSFSAGGIVHTNIGTFTNAYYSSKVVVNGSWLNRFATQPVLFSNTATIGGTLYTGTRSNIVYDSSVYLLNVTVNSVTFSVTPPNPALQTGETTAVLKSSASSLNTESDRWYFYAQDVYPLLLGMPYVSGAYEIDSAVDLVFFSRLIGFATVANGTAYGAATYRLKNNIDMSEVAPGAYRTPSVNFNGTLSGTNPGGSDLSDNYYIYNLHLTRGTLRGTNYYAGLFSILGATGRVEDLNINASSIQLSDTEAVYSYLFYIGMIAGRNSGGTIEDVQVDVPINLGTQALGETAAGGIVGQSSGLIQRVSFSGSIDAGIHVFQSSYNVAPVYNIGGIVGAAAANALTMKNVVNNAPITGFSTTSTFNLASGYTQILTRTGGVIGYVLHTATIKHGFVNVANKADITFRDVINTVGLPSEQRIGGVFGEMAGLGAPVLETAGVFVNANYYNEGDIIGAYAASTATIRAAGIGVANMSVATEYALFFNHGTFQYTTTGASSPTGTFLYTGTVYDIGSASLTLTRVYNYGNLAISSNFYTTVNPLYYSLANNATVIRYSINYGNVSVMANGGAGVITLAANSPLTVSGITTSSNIDYLNVTNKGSIDVVNLSIGSNELNVSGITYQLTSGKYIKNTLNEGDITVAKINGTAIIFLGGIVNRNYSGDLHNAGVTKATIGILNTINYGAISTSYGLKTDNLYGITGTSNTFAGGVATLNLGSIQDSGNLGDISLYNSNTGGAITVNTNVTYAGRVEAYTAGVTAGGIAAMSMTGNSRIYDTANIGDVTAVAYRYSRAGGILAVSLYSESTAGGITTGMGLANTIQNSILSNGLNYGAISSMTNVIATYATSYSASSVSMYYGTSTSSNTTIYIAGTEERPGIYSSAGGIIGYGLCVMTRMLNHGTISATDVAGGIVGATYIVGSATTVVNINTAINYGSVKAIPAANVMAGASRVDEYLLSYDDYSTFFMADGNTFIFPTGYTREEPKQKRGFGGIFGRLQRGNSGIMTSAGGAFDFIVNVNPNVDLIGRLDQVQNFTSSSMFFRFNDAIYYSAKYNDTTQVVFTGYYYAISRYVSRVLVSGVYTYTMRANTVYTRVGITPVLYSTPGTNYTFRSTGSFTNANTNYYGYYGPIEVPWITENPSDVRITDANAQYMYSPNFPMRSNPALTEYIYYIESNLLAPRFQVGGDNPRPNGMYVLSTSFGATFGSVLPSNISDTALFPINEDLVPAPSLNLDYNAVSSANLKPIDQTVLDKYADLKQTLFNDKSAIVDIGANSVVLTENGGSSTFLSNGTIDDINKRVTYTISLEAFDPLQASVSYAVTQASISSKGLVAKRPDDQYGGPPTEQNLDDYRVLLYPERNMTISTAYAPTLNVNLPARTITTNQTVTLGYFSIFSEAYLNSNLYAHTAYYTDYQVQIVFTPTAAQIPTGTTGINTVQFNGGAAVTVTNQSDVTGLGDVNYNGSIRFNFRDTKGIWAAGYDFSSYISIRYQDGTVVSPSYYTLTSIPVVIAGSNRDFVVTIAFTDQTKSGNYYMDYKYFASSPTLSVLFDKAASSQNLITALDYYSNDGSTTIGATTISSSVNLGYPITVSGFTTNSNGSVSYLSNTTYDVSFMTTGSFRISPFAQLISVQLLGTSLINGYKTFQIQYVVQAENGTQRTYTQNIVERTIDLTAVLKNGNETSLSDVFAIREDLTTEFRVDLGLDATLNLYRLEDPSYSYIQIAVTAKKLDNVTVIPAEDIVGITYREVNEQDFYIDMDYTTIPGFYTFSFRFYRDGSTTEYVTLSTPLVIRKNAGTNPYLFDIRFSNIANETSYPIIRPTDVDGVVLTGTGLDMRVFFGGIDYDGADTLGYRYFRVDGQVSNTPLDEYVPRMIEYLPYGATIARYAYNGTSWYWTTEVNAASSQEDKNTLIADFTVFPDTLLEPEEGEDVIIRYRVTSEDGLTFTYYNVTVTDINFNVTLIFDIYYCTGPGVETCTLASSSAQFANQLVIITVKNYDTNGDANTINVVDPDDYPTFSVINGLNNQMTQFYYTYSGQYRYSFGRNISGFYVFNLELPLDRYLNPRYEYTIEHQFYLLNDASDYIPGLPGKYFYIEAGTRNRTRRFNIFIRELSAPITTAPWGLFDFFRTWGEEN